MPIYVVTVKEVFERIVTIEAPCEETAADMVYQGRYPEIGSTFCFSHFLKDETIIELDE